MPVLYSMWMYWKEMNFYRLIFDKVIYKHPNTTVIQTLKTDNSQNSGEKFLTKTNNEQAFSEFVVQMY